MFTINNRSTWRLPGEFIVNSEYIWHFVLVFFWWVWMCKCRMEYFYCSSLHLSMCFRVQSRSPVTFITKLSVTTDINILLLLCTHFFQKISILDVATKCCSKIHENSNRYWLRGEPLWLRATLGKYQKLTLLDLLKIHFERFFRLSSLQLISNGLNGVNINFVTWL